MQVSEQNPYQNFINKSQKYWTVDRLKKITSGRKYLVLPTNAPVLLRELGILNQDASMSADHTRKFIQVNHLLNFFKPHFDDLNERHKVVRILDAGCGSGVLTFLLAWAYQTLWHHNVKMIGVDANKTLIEKNTKAAERLGVTDSLSFIVSPIHAIDWPSISGPHAESDSLDPKKIRPHAVVALHACDTATDDAIALGIKQQADFIAVAPCCQVELSNQWKDLCEGEKGKGTFNHPMAPLFRNPHLRREVAAHMTDMARVLILRGHGYEVTTTEFTMSHATPKNTLIVAVRRGSYLKEAQVEYQQMVEALGGKEISLAAKVPW